MFSQKKYNCKNKWKKSFGRFEEYKSNQRHPENKLTIQGHAKKGPCEIARPLNFYLKVELTHELLSRSVA